jgi:hypothetical protein
MMADEARASSVMAKLMSSNLGDKAPENDLDRAYQHLAAKLPGYNDLWGYYDGDQPLMYTAERLQDLFKDLNLATFVENWCAVVIDSAADRMEVKEISVVDKTQAELLRTWWDEKSLALEMKDTHEAALVIGESYIIVWEDPDKEDEPELFYNDPRLCHLFYEPGNQRKKWYGVKWYVDAENHVVITLYYSDRLEYYRSDKEQNQVSSFKNFQPYDPDTKTQGDEKDLGEGGNVREHDYEEVPMFHYRTERRVIKGDLANVVPLQNGVNKLVTDMMVAAEYGAFKQRWIISNADTSELKNAPNEIWDVPAGDGTGQQTTVGEFDPTDLNNYIQAIDHLASSAAIISRTPKHYLFQQGGDPSGEALIAMEAPLNKRVEDHISQFEPVWKDVARFMLKISGVAVETKDISVTFSPPETIQPLTEAEVRKTSVETGIPLVTMLRDEGKDEAWLEQMAKDKAEEDAAKTASLGQALLASMRTSNEEEFPPSSEGEGQQEPEPTG